LVVQQRRRRGAEDAREPLKHVDPLADLCAGVMEVSMRLYHAAFEANEEA
jgi:hypothetical protein